MFKKSTFILVILTLVFQFLSPASAVENGTDATGSDLIVPIIIQTGTNTYAGCSGALLLPTVVVTAAHCTLDSNGQGSQNIKIGPPGSKNTYDAKTWATVTNTNFSVEYQGAGIGGTVTRADIAVLVIDKVFTLNTMVTLASENQLLSIKSAGGKLKLMGYGYQTDAGQEAMWPSGFEATYTQLTGSDPNQSFAESSSANACAGDSGGPVLYITPTRVMLVGVITGAFFANKCSKKQSNGKYLTGFSIINRFANLAMVSATQALNTELTLEKKMTDQITQLQTDLNDAKSQLAKSKDELDILKTSTDVSISNLNAQIEELKMKIPSTILCKKGKLTQKVTSINPKCPTGYSKK